MAYSYLSRAVTSGSFVAPAESDILNGKLPVIAHTKAYYRKDPNLYCQVNPYIPWATQEPNDNLYIQSNNSSYNPVGAPTINQTTGVAGNATDGRTNFNWVTDPTDATRLAMLMQCSYSDAGGTGGSSQRTEWTFAPATYGLTIGQTYWSAIRVCLPTNIRSAGSTDELIIYQHHDNHPTANLNPSMSLIAFGGTGSSKLRITLKGNTSSTPEDGNAVARSFDVLTPYNANQWYTFVFQFKKDWRTAGTPFFKAWLDGSLVVNDTQVNDFNADQINTPSQRTYPKLGVYHYLSGTWAAGDARGCYHKGYLQYKDDGQITEPFMRACIEAY